MISNSKQLIIRKDVAKKKNIFWTAITQQVGAYFK